MKKAVIAMFALAVIAMFAGNAVAETYDVNIYGASAQFTFWKTLASDFLDSEITGCDYDYDNIKQITFDKNFSMSRCVAEDGSGNPTGDIYNIRYGSVASYTGIFSIGALTDPSGMECPEGWDYRKMVDEGTATIGTGPGPFTATGKKCVKVNIGASDVSPAAFTQSTQGYENWDTTTFVTWTFNGLDPEANGRNIKIYKPIIVPFAFFANKDLTGVDNLTRMQALNIFSGKVNHWRQFGTTFPKAWVAVCLRHAGSGTHATLDNAVMKNDLGLLGVEDVGKSFNKSSSHMATCVNQNADLNETGGLGTFGDPFIAIGYIDADKNLLVKCNENPTVNCPGATPDDDYDNMKMLKYQGVEASAANIINGLYPFWASQNTMINEAVETEDALIDQIVSFAGDSTKLPLLKKYVTGDLAGFWLPGSTTVVNSADPTTTNARFNKGSDDAYPEFNIIPVWGATTEGGGFSWTSY